MIYGPALRVLVACNTLQANRLEFVHDSAIAERSKLTLAEVRDCLLTLQSDDYVSLLMVNDGYETQIESKGRLYLSQNRGLPDNSDFLDAGGVIEGWNWRKLVPRSIEFVRALPHQRVSLGTFALMGVFTLLVIIPLSVARSPAKAEKPPDLIAIDSTELVTHERLYNPIGEIKDKQDESCYKRMKPLAFLCKSLHPLPNEKNWSAVVAVRSAKFKAPYQAFTASTICARVRADEADKENENEPICFAFLVSDENNASVLRSLHVSEAKPLSDAPRYREFTYPVPESKAGDQLFVIVGLSQRSYDASKYSKDETSSKDEAFKIRTKP